MRTACLLFALMLPGLSSAGQTPEQAAENWLPPRPAIDAYDNEAGFVADVLRWEQERDRLAAEIARGERPERPSEPVKDHDWHHVTGPEDLEVALQNAEGYEQPHYQEHLRFNRTTHISFPLPPLGSEQMARERVQPPEQPASESSVPLVMIDDAGYLVLPPAPEPD